MHRTSESSISVEYTNYDIEKVAGYIKAYFTDIGNTKLLEELGIE